MRYKKIVFLIVFSIGILYHSEIFAFVHKIGSGGTDVYFPSNITDSNSLIFKISKDKDYFLLKPSSESKDGRINIKNVFIPDDYAIESYTKINRSNYGNFLDARNDNLSKVTECMNPELLQCGKETSDSIDIVIGRNGKQDYSSKNGRISENITIRGWLKSQKDKEDYLWGEKNDNFFFSKTSDFFQIHSFKYLQPNATYCFQETHLENEEKCISSKIVCCKTQTIYGDSFGDEITYSNGMAYIDSKNYYLVDKIENIGDRDIISSSVFKDDGCFNDLLTAYKLETIGISSSGKKIYPIYPIQHPYTAVESPIDNDNKNNSYCKTRSDKNESLIYSNAIFSDITPNDPFCVQTLFYNKKTKVKREYSKGCIFFPISIQENLSCQENKNSISVRTKIKNKFFKELFSVRIALSREVVDGSGKKTIEKKYSKWFFGIDEILIDDNIFVSDGLWKPSLEIRNSAGIIYESWRFNDGYIPKNDDGNDLICKKERQLINIDCNYGDKSLFLDFKIALSSGPDEQIPVIIKIYDKKSREEIVPISVDIAQNIFTDAKDSLIFTPGSNRIEINLQRKGAMISSRNEAYSRIEIVPNDISKEYYSKIFIDGSEYESLCRRDKIKIKEHYCSVSQDYLEYYGKIDIESGNIPQNAKIEAIALEKNDELTMPEFVDSEIKTFSYYPNGSFRSSFLIDELDDGNTYCFKTKITNNLGDELPINFNSLDYPCCIVPRRQDSGYHSVSFNKIKGKKCYYLKINNNDNNLEIFPQIYGGKFVGGTSKLSGFFSDSSVRYAMSGTFYKNVENIAQPEGIIMNNGKLLRLYNDGGGSFCQEYGGGVRVGKLSMGLRAKISEISGDQNPYKYIIISQINSTNNDPMIRMFTPEWGGILPLIKGKGKYISVDENGLINGIYNNRIEIPNKGYVLIYNNIGEDRFDCISNPKGCIKVGYHLELDWYPEEGNYEDLQDWKKQCKNIISGRPLLISDGKVSDYAWTGMGTHSRGRSAIGVIDKNNIIMMVCNGLTGPEMAKVMIRIGVKDAVNMDGGGSTFLINNPLLNNVSDNGRMIKGFYDGRILSNIIVVKE